MEFALNGKICPLWVATSRILGSWMVSEGESEPSTRGHLSVSVFPDSGFSMTSCLILLPLSLPQPGELSI